MADGAVATAMNSRNSKQERIRQIDICELRVSIKGLRLSRAHRPGLKPDLKFMISVFLFFLKMAWKSRPANHQPYISRFNSPHVSWIIMYEIITAIFLPNLNNC